jgi:hypothetical protein
MLRTIIIGFGLAVLYALLNAGLAHVQGVDPLLWGLLTLGLAAATVLAHGLINERRPPPGGSLAA